MSEETNLVGEIFQEPAHPLTRRQLLRAAAMGGVALGPVRTSYCVGCRPIAYMVLSEPAILN